MWDVVISELRIVHEIPEVRLELLAFPIIIASFALTLY